ncbi:hypothetical protein XBP1_3010045 [Xenorhabdus bovienii str. puntauvense]|uniref:Uncharacterized protein n=1 Tax=Xenorhabdus bovienii str. puntauvense TaxID=1398201 RepID=A0A077N844_XENBV|nr:hypothetical protein XBFFR1_2070067 [Xenorhabdus bovienii str. feltiae France]CDG90941.1 hypothetical protein XBFFL1_1190035 [Xenorhabdus bovienii str. feltiae Florida]CDG98396.1 hypothetical protein XBP1_3010045 [Xenorhabdus bovienii str. puntauvense]
MVFIKRLIEYLIDYYYKKITPAKKNGVILPVAVISSCFSPSEKTT